MYLNPCWYVERYGDTWSTKQWCRKLQRSRHNITEILSHSRDIGYPNFFYVVICRSIFSYYESVCAVIKSFLSIRCLSIPMQPINESYEKYLMSVGVAFPGLCGSITFNLTLLVLDIIFVFYCRYGYECLAWSYVIAYYSAVTVEISIRYLLSAFKDPFFLSLFTISRSIYFHDFEHKNITT